MRSSENITELAKALLEAQKVMKHAPKDAVNPFHKSRYADLVTVVDTLREPLTDNGLCYAQGTSMEGDRVVVTTRLIHAPSGQWIETDTASKTKGGEDPQSVGGAITYLRRYGLSAIVGLVADDDDDGNQSSGRPAAPAQRQSAPPPRAQAPARPAAPKPAPANVQEWPEHKAQYLKVEQDILAAKQITDDEEAKSAIFTIRTIWGKWCQKHAGGEKQPQHMPPELFHQACERVTEHCIKQNLVPRND